MGQLVLKGLTYHKRLRAAGLEVEADKTIWLQWQITQLLKFGICISYAYDKVQKFQQQSANVYQLIKAVK